MMTGETVNYGDDVTSIMKLMKKGKRSQKMKIQSRAPLPQVLQASDVSTYLNFSFFTVLFFALSSSKLAGFEPLPIRYSAPLQFSWNQG